MTDGTRGSGRKFLRVAFCCGFLISLLFVSLGAAEAELLGRVLEKVTCTADPTQSYALYVPANYRREKNWPVIYCFDPGARGLAPVERLKTAAEKFGYIVAGSNNSRNGPWEANEAAIQAMTRDVASHLAIDRRRVYTAGLSGGARVAVQLALLGYAKGVIACSAGFPTQGEGVPSRVAFPLFGTAGREDFNYRELKQLDADLEDRKAAYRIVVFAGGHEWAPAELLTSAVEWLELQAMRSGTRLRDEAFIASLWQNRLAAVPTLPVLARWRELKAVAADFKGLADTADIESQAKKLAGSAELKAERKSERDLIVREGELLEKLESAVGRSRPAQQKLVAEVRGGAEAAEDSPERQMMRRVLAGYFYLVREDVRDLFATHDYAQAVKILELAVELRPKQARTWLDLARARAFARDDQRALDALRQAAGAGLSDAGRVEAEPAFAKLKTEPAFLEIVASIRANPPEPERGPGEGGRRFP